jgi:hypothetical protein
MSNLLINFINKVLGDSRLKWLSSANKLPNKLHSMGQHSHNKRGLKMDEQAKAAMNILLDKAEQLHPTNLIKQYRVVRTYTTGAAFDDFCECKGIKGDFKRKIYQLIVTSDRGNLSK